jgi:hypothetical protein
MNKFRGLSKDISFFDFSMPLTFPVKSERDANLHRDLAISTNRAKALECQWVLYGDVPDNLPSELLTPMPKQLSKLGVA